MAPRMFAGADRPPGRLGHPEVGPFRNELWSEPLDADALKSESKTASNDF